jgi:hypothetical protein
LVASRSRVGRFLRSREKRNASSPTANNASGRPTPAPIARLLFDLQLFDSFAVCKGADVMVGGVVGFAPVGEAETAVLVAVAIWYIDGFPPPNALGQA